MTSRPHIPDDRRFMDFETRAIDDPRYRGKREEEKAPPLRGDAERARKLRERTARLRKERS